MGATASISLSATTTTTSSLLQLLVVEANKPVDLSDVSPSHLNLPNLRSEVARLRRLLHRIAIDDTLHTVDLRPAAFQQLNMPIPTDNELQAILQGQIAAKKVLEARLRNSKQWKMRYQTDNTIAKPIVVCIVDNIIDTDNISNINDRN